MATVVSLVATEAQSRAVAEAAWVVEGSPVRHVSTQSLSELFDTLAEHPGAIPIFDPFWSGKLRLDQLAQLLVADPRSEPIVYCRIDPGPVFRSSMGELGLGRVITAGVDDSVHQLRVHIAAALGEAHLIDLVQSLTQQMTSGQRVTFRWAVRNGALDLGLGPFPRAAGSSGDPRPADPSSE